MLSKLPPGSLSTHEWRFGLVISSVHGVQHLFYRLFPPLIPILVIGLDSPLWQLGSLVSIYLFAGGLGQAPMGILVDKFDRQYILLPAIGLMSVGYLLFVLGSAVGPALPAVELFGHSFSGTYQIMAGGMFVAGVGYSGIHPVGYPLISANISAEGKATVLGMWGSASKLGDTLAPLLIGGLILVVPWEWILVGVSLFGFVYASWLWLVFRASGIETRPPSTLGEASAGGSSRASTGRSSRDSSGAAGGSWRANPRQFLYPMVTILLAFCFILFATNGLITFAPVFITDVYGYSLSVGDLVIPSESVANAYFSVLLLSGALSQLLVGAVAKRFDYRLLLIGLLALTTAGLAVLAVRQLTPVVLVAVFALVGACLFGINPIRDALISDITPPAYEGRTFGYFWTIVLLVSSGYPLVIGYLGDTVGIQASFQYLAAGTLVGIAGIALLYSPRLYRQRTSTAVETEPERQ
ncbi:MAG: MFS transporter [Euryarchaeota archaeon]|nr:MFS transporter [Euryarchaeota archaeon]